MNGDLTIVFIASVVATFNPTHCSPPDRVARSPVVTVAAIGSLLVGASLVG
jgi:hypothetical protein